MKYLIAAILALPAFGAPLVAPIGINLDMDGNPSVVWDNKLIPATPAYTGDHAAVVALVAQNFAPFNVVVSQGSNPGVQGQSVHVVIGGNGSWFGGVTGVTNLGELYEPEPTAWVFPENLLNRPDLVAAVATHELGHAGGLEHQSTWVNGVKTAEYAPGYFMGDTSTSPLAWGVGTSSSGRRQDDYEILDTTYGAAVPETIWGIVGMLGVYLLTKRRHNRQSQPRPSSHGTRAIDSTRDSIRSSALAMADSASGASMYRSPGSSSIVYVSTQRPVILNRHICDTRLAGNH